MYRLFVYVADDSYYGADFAGTEESKVRCGEHDWVFRSVQSFSTPDEALAWDYEHKDLRDTGLFELMSGNMNLF